jgi:O-antigen/teichoic acid export membrane protein
MAVMFSATSVSNVLGYVFTILMGRMLGPVGFGIFVAVQAIFDLIAISGSAIRTIVARQVAAYEACHLRNDTCRLLDASIWRTLVYTAIVSAALFLARDPIAALLGIPLRWCWRWQPSSDSRHGPCPARGFQQGVQWFMAMGGREMITGALRVAAGVALVTLGAGAAGAIAAQPLAAAVVSLVGLAILGPRIRRERPLAKEPMAEAAPQIAPLPVLLSLFAFAALTQMDAILVKSLFSAEAAGQYAAAVTLGKIILMLPTAISTVLLPRVTRAFTLQQDSGTIMWVSLGLGALPCGLVAAAYSLWPDAILGVVLGDQYVVSGAVLGILGAAMTFRALTNVWLNYYLSIRQNAFLYAMLAAVALQLGWVILFHGSLVQVVGGLLGAALLLNIAGVLLFRRAPQRREPLHIAPSSLAPGAEGTMLHEDRLVYDVIYPYVKGGAERRIYELGRRLAARTKCTSMA